MSVMLVYFIYLQAERVNYDERGAAALVRAQLSTIIEAIDSGFDNVVSCNINSMNNLIENCKCLISVLRYE